VSEGLSAAATLDLLAGRGFDYVLIIPDSESRHLYERAVADDRFVVISPAREGESIAIAAGLWTGGAKPILVIQNTGLMEAGDALRGCGVGPRVPLRMLVGWRGYVGAIAGRLPIDSAYPHTEPLLAAWNIPFWHAMSDDDLPAIATMDDTATETGFPAAVLTGHPFRP
jgi:sulfopyruvate decarboxylase TPP-binding subunit